MRRAAFTTGLPAPAHHGHAARSVGAALVAALAAIATCATLAGCSSDPVRGPGPLPGGTWGGSQGNLAVYADSATFDLPCAAARIPSPIVTDADGRFDLSGQWAVQAGPVFPGDVNWQSARFTGQRSGDLLEITVHIDSGVTLSIVVIGPLTFRRGVVGDFARCL